MFVSDRSGDCHISSVEDLEKMLVQACNEKVGNEFWITRSGEEDPVLAVVVKGRLASINYFPGSRDAGFLSQGSVRGLKRDGMTRFATRGEPVEVPNHAIVPFADALLAAKEFWYSRELPKSINWLKL